MSIAITGLLIGNIAISSFTNVIGEVTNNQVLTITIKPDQVKADLAKYKKDTQVQTDSTKNKSYNQSQLAILNYKKDEKQVEAYIKTLPCLEYQFVITIDGNGLSIKKPPVINGTKNKYSENSDKYNLSQSDMEEISSKYAFTDILNAVSLGNAIYADPRDLLKRQKQESQTLDKVAYEFLYERRLDEISKIYSLDEFYAIGYTKDDIITADKIASNKVLDLKELLIKSKTENKDFESVKNEIIDNSRENQILRFKLQYPDVYAKLEAVAANRTYLYCLTTDYEDHQVDSLDNFIDAYKKNGTIGVYYLYLPLRPAIITPELEAYGLIQDDLDTIPLIYMTSFTKFIEKYTANGKMTPKEAAKKFRDLVKIINNTSKH